VFAQKGFKKTLDDGKNVHELVTVNPEVSTDGHKVIVKKVVERKVGSFSTRESLDLDKWQQRLRETDVF